MKIQFEGDMAVSDRPRRYVAALLCHTAAKRFTNDLMTVCTTYLERKYYDQFTKHLRHIL